MNDSVISWRTFGDDDQMTDLLKRITSVLSQQVPLGLMVVGVTGNILSFVLLSQTQYRSSSTCLYMRALAVSDSCYLIFKIGRTVAIILFDSLVQSFIFCSGMFAVVHTFASVSSILLAAMSLDRLIAVAVPLKAKILCSIRRARITIFASLVVNILIYTTVNFFRQRRSYTKITQSCLYALPGNLGSYYAHLRLIAVYYIPLGIMFVANVGIICVILRRQGKTSKLHQQDDSGKKSKDGYITVMLLTVSISSFVFLFPNKAMNIYYSSVRGKLDPRSIVLRDMISSVTTLLLYCNYGMNFYAYTLPIAKFRTELLGLFCLVCTRRK
ncbi:FMRFamide peptide receptor frpr-18-like [Lineus longissimus]|uniref:FMRFamide peptide receptor frpr-18-like n=1 Tax=Lineus longissimus TaxID=88925 RepID=UPI002B4DF2CA